MTVQNARRPVFSGAKEQALLLFVLIVSAAVVGIHAYYFGL